jgi:hypothetical protein
VTEVMLCTLEDVKSALDIPETARSDAQLIREIQASSRGIEGDVLRFFYPSVSTQYFDWPDHQYAAPWRLWLDQRELTSVTQVLAAGLDITSSVLLRPDDAPLHGQPYTKIELDLSTNAAFNAGSTFQRSIAVTGTYGYTADETAGGQLAAAVTDTTGTTVTVTDSTLVGVGNLLRVDTERMNVTGRAMTSTGQTITTSPSAQTNANTIGVPDGTKFAGGETILVDAEQMRIDAITGNNVTVTRSWNGSVLAAHYAGATVYAPRQLTVERGVLGTTAATHSNTAPVAVHRVPSLIRDWCVAETVATLTQVRRGYGTVIKRSTGSSASPGDPVDLSSALPDLRNRARARYARLRKRTAARLI